jgi:hypothetical protein
MRSVMIESALPVRSTHGRYPAIYYAAVFGLDLYRVKIKPGAIDSS